MNVLSKWLYTLKKEIHITVFSPLIIWQPQINPPLTGCFASVPISTCICYLIKCFSKDFQKQQMQVSTSITSYPANGDALVCSRLHALLVWIWEMPQTWLHRTGAVCPAAPELSWNIKAGNQKDHWSRGLDTTSELTSDLCQVGQVLKTRICHVKKGREGFAQKDWCGNIFSHFRGEVTPDC